jgi:hypothetical protein
VPVDVFVGVYKKRGAVPIARYMPARIIGGDSGQRIEESKSRPLILTNQMATWKNAKEIAEQDGARFPNLKDFIARLRPDSALETVMRYAITGTKSEGEHNRLDDNATFLKRSQGNQYWIDDELPDMKLQESYKYADGCIKACCKIDFDNCVLVDVGNEKAWALLPFEQRAYVEIGEGPLRVYIGYNLGRLQISTDKNMNGFARIALIERTTDPDPAAALAGQLRE